MFEMPTAPRSEKEKRENSREDGFASEALHERVVYTTMDGEPTISQRERFTRSLYQENSAGEAIAHEQAWVADAVGKSESDAETATDLERIVALGQEKFMLIEKWKGRVDHKNPEYLEDMQQLATIISELVRLEMKSVLGHNRLDS